MGGKGGGGGITPQQMGMVYDPDAMGPGMPGYESQADYDAAHPKAADPAPAAAAPAAAATPAAATDDKKAATTDDAGPPAAPADPGTAATAGGAIAQPSAADNPAAATSGGTLSSAVLNPPAYWVGGQYNKPTNTSSAVSSSQT